MYTLELNLDKQHYTEGEDMVFTVRPKIDQGSNAKTNLIVIFTVEDRNLFGDLAGAIGPGWWPNNGSYSLSAATAEIYDNEYKNQPLNTYLKADLVDLDLYGFPEGTPMSQSETRALMDAAEYGTLQNKYILASDIKYFTILDNDGEMNTLPPDNQQQTPTATGTNNNTGGTNSNTGAINISGTINNSGTINTGTIDNSVTNIDNSTTIIYNTDNSTNTETNNTDNSVNTATNNTYTSVSNIQVSLSALMTGSSQGKDVVTGTDGSDTIGAGKGKDKLQGGTGADIFAFSKKDKFGKKGADIITDFKPEEGDKIALSAKALPGLKSAEFGIAANKSELKSLYKSAANIIYYQPKGRLIYDQNGSDKGFGEGGIFSILTGSPEINVGDFGIF